MPLLSIILLNYKGTTNHTITCVAELQNQTIIDQSEIIVVDNHSDDDSIGILRNRLGRYPNVRIVESRINLGYGGGNNLGSHYASGEFLLIMNPDTHPSTPDTLERLLTELQSDPSIGIGAPKLVFGDGTVRESSVRFPSPLDVIIKRTPLKRVFPKRMDRYLQRDRVGTDPRDTDWIHGACFLTRTDTFQKIGGFDERFFLFFDDIDLCRRSWNAGLRVVYMPQIECRDHHLRLSGDTLRDLFCKKTGRIHVQSALKYFWKWRKETPAFH